MSKNAMIVIGFWAGLIVFMAGFFVGEFSMSDRMDAIEQQRNRVYAQLAEMTESLNRSTETINRCNQALRGAQ